MSRAKKPLEINLSLVLRPVSINDAYYRAGQLTKVARQYRYDLLTAILKHKKEIQEFRTAALDLINKHSHALRLEIVHLVPNDTFYNKAGQLSMRAGDVSNLIKVTEDFLLNTRYNSDCAPNKGKEQFELKDGQLPYNIGIDDRFVQSIVTSKLPYDGDRWQVKVTVSVIPIAHAKAS